MFSEMLDRGAWQAVVEPDDERRADNCERACCCADYVLSVYELIPEPGLAYDCFSYLPATLLKVHLSIFVPPQNNV